MPSGDTWRPGDGPDCLRAMRSGGGILGVALVATLGNYAIAQLNVRHSITTGIIHGAVLLRLSNILGA